MALTEKELITRMIKDDLINYRLVMGLNELGLVTEQYFLHASDTIFEYMGIKTDNKDDPGYKLYEKHKNKILDFNLADNPEKLDKITEIIYRELIYRRQLQSSVQ